MKTFRASLSVAAVAAVGNHLRVCISGQYECLTCYPAPLHAFFKFLKAHPKVFLLTRIKIKDSQQVVSAVNFAYPCILQLIF